MSSSVGCRVRSDDGRRGTVILKGPSNVRMAWDGDEPATTVPAETVQVIGVETRSLRCV